VLIIGAGSAAGENLIRSLSAGDPALVLVGCNEDQFVLRRSSAQALYLVPPRSREFIGALRRLIDDIGIDLIVPTNDAHVRALSDGRARLRSRVFLPPPAVIELCQDKVRSIAELRRYGIPSPETYPLTGLRSIRPIFDRLGDPPLWCRPRTGTCARGGAAVASPDQARSWIELWRSMQGIPVRSFTLSKYLPGREILCQSLWDGGRLVLVNTFQRLAYFGVDNIPSGVTSLSSLAKTVVAPAAVEVCCRAVRAVAPEASGAFSIDVKEDSEGRPHVTEINAGRLFMAMTRSTASPNTALTYVRLALGERVELGEAYDAVDGYYMTRDLDSEPGVFHADDLFVGINTIPRLRSCSEPNTGGSSHGLRSARAGRGTRGEHRTRRSGR
jgi:carbamoyl-phosphate synthase large subunit